MNISFLLDAANAGSGDVGGGGGSMTSFLVMMLLIFVVMWFMMIRPQQKRQKKIREFQNALKEGDSVVTAGGVYGTVKSIDLQNGKVQVSISKGVVIEVDKSYLFADTAALSMQPK